MGESSFEIRPVEKPSEKRLDSWKEIAAYLNRDVTTVQRWEKREGMPVHRHLHDRVGSVYAFPAELDQWAQSRKLQTEQSNAVSSPSAATPTDRLSVSSRTSDSRAAIHCFVGGRCPAGARRKFLALSDGILLAQSGH